MDAITTKLLRQILRTMERLGRDGLQKHPNTGTKAQIADEHSDDSRTPLRIIAETDFPREVKEQYRTDQDKTYGLQQWSFVVQAFLCLFTLGAFIAAIHYAQTASFQLDTMNESLKEAHIQNVAQQRALLAVEQIASSPETRELEIKIKNHGHLAATVSSYAVTYRQHVSYGQSFTRQREAKPHRIITAGDIYGIYITTPEVPAYVKGKGVWDVMALIFIKYDDGFGNTEALSSCLSPDPVSKTWAAACLSVDFIDLSKQLASDPKPH